MVTKVQDTTADADTLKKYLPVLAPLVSGTTGMRVAGKALLPIWESEEESAWKNRLAMATLFPAYDRTCNVLSSRPFSEPVVISDDSPSVFKEEWALNIDSEGSTIDQFAQRLLYEALGLGFVGILVDAPSPDIPVTTRAEEKAEGLRPYLCSIHLDQLLGWKFTQDGDEYSFTQLRYMEKVSEDDGEFGTAIVEQIRVLEPNKWRTFRKKVVDGVVKPDEWVLYKEGATGLDYVPFVPVYGRYKSFMNSLPPMLDLAYMNIKHWQSQSDQDTILHFARVPILTMIGGDEKTKIVIGGTSAVVVPIGGDLKFTEHTGASINAGQASLDALEKQMMQAGAELLVVRPGKTTATQVYAENEAGISTLQRIVLNLQHSLNKALEYMAEMGGEDTSPEVTLFQDFGVTSLTDASADLLLKMNMAGKLSDETLFREQQRRGLIDGALKWEEEQTKITEQGGSLGDLTLPGTPGAPIPGETP